MAGLSRRRALTRKLKLTKAPLAFQGREELLAVLEGRTRSFTVPDGGHLYIKRGNHLGRRTARENYEMAAGEIVGMGERHTKLSVQVALWAGVLPEWRGVRFGCGRPNITVGNYPRRFKGVKNS